MRAQIRKSRVEEESDSDDENKHELLGIHFRSKAQEKEKEKERQKAKAAAERAAAAAAVDAATAKPEVVDASKGYAAALEKAAAEKGVAPETGGGGISIATLILHCKSLDPEKGEELDALGRQWADAADAPDEEQAALKAKMPGKLRKLVGRDVLRNAMEEMALA